MDHRVFSGVVWIGFALFMIGEGLFEVFKRGQQEAWVYVAIGVFILVFQLWLYKKTGSIGGPL